MKIAAANKKLDAIIEKVEKEGITAAGLIEDLKELREFALKEADPLVTKVIRLSYEFLTEKEALITRAKNDEVENGGKNQLEMKDKDN